MHRSQFSPQSSVTIESNQSTFDTTQLPAVSHRFPLAMSQDVGVNLVQVLRSESPVSSALFMHETGRLSRSKRGVRRTCQRRTVVHTFFETKLVKKTVSCPFPESRPRLFYQQVCASRFVNSPLGPNTSEPLLNIYLIANSLNEPL